jgi:hypothetical protein
MTSLVLDGRTQSRDAMLQKMVNARHDIMALEDIRFVKSTTCQWGHGFFSGGFNESLRSSNEDTGSAFGLLLL